MARWDFYPCQGCMEHGCQYCSHHVNRVEDNMEEGNNLIKTRDKMKPLSNEELTFCLKALSDAYGSGIRLEYNDPKGTFEKKMAALKEAKKILSGDLRLLS